MQKRDSIHISGSLFSYFFFLSDNGFENRRMLFDGPLFRPQTELKYPSKNRRHFTQRYNMTKIILFNGQYVPSSILPLKS